jgi:hypothetical protein
MSVLVAGAVRLLMSGSQGESLTDEIIYLCCKAIGFFFILAMVKCRQASRGYW